MSILEKLFKRRKVPKRVANLNQQSCPIDRLKEKAANGDMEAQVELAKRYVKGIELPVNEMEAGRLYLLAAEGGNAKAQEIVSVMYEKGRLGFPIDGRKSFEWALKAATNGSVAMQVHVGRIYFGGNEFIGEDLNQAFQWCLKAANQGDPMAQYMVGWMYGTGNGVTKSIPDARKWFQKSAQQGNNAAIEALRSV